MLRVSLMLIALAVMPSLAQAQDVGAGEKSFNKCRACHQVGETAKNGVGPPLNGLFGRKSGSYDGYSYTEANKTSGITWDDAVFAEYIKDPKAKIPGTKMAFPGLPKAADRACGRRTSARRSTATCSPEAPPTAGSHFRPPSPLVGSAPRTVR